MIILTWHSVMNVFWVCLVSYLSLPLSSFRRLQHHHHHSQLQQTIHITFPSPSPGSLQTTSAVRTRESPSESASLHGTLAKHYQTRSIVHTIPKRYPSQAPKNRSARNEQKHDASTNHRIHRSIAKTVKRIQQMQIQNRREEGPFHRTMEPRLLSPTTSDGSNPRGVSTSSRLFRRWEWKDSSRLREPAPSSAETPFLHTRRSSPRREEVSRSCGEARCPPSTHCRRRRR